MQNYDYCYLFKVLIVGDSGVGKSSLMIRFADDCFHECYLSTIGVDFKIRTLELYNSYDPQMMTLSAEEAAAASAMKIGSAKFQIWDTAGQEKFRSIVSSYYRGAHGVILAYDTTNEASLENALRQWLPEVKRHVANPQVPILLVGTKADLTSSRMVTLEQAQSLAMGHGLPVPVETSSKDSSNVELAFRVLGQMIQKEKKLDPKANQEQHSISDGSIPLQNTYGSCSC